jgi:hypothetical protein
MKNMILLNTKIGIKRGNLRKNVKDRDKIKGDKRYIKKDTNLTHICRPLEQEELGEN